MYPSPSISSAPNPRGSPPSERLVACHWCDDHANDRAATAAHVAVAMPGALTAGDLLCDACAADLDADVAREDAKAVSL